MPSPVPHQPLEQMLEPIASLIEHGGGLVPAVLSAIALVLRESPGDAFAKVFAAGERSIPSTSTVRDTRHEETQASIVFGSRAQARQDLARKDTE